MHIEVTFIQQYKSHNVRTQRFRAHTVGAHAEYVVNALITGIIFPQAFFQILLFLLK